jgi:division protein CdvB (Snf7/Vps24/ESCRT-III family)
MDTMQSKLSFINRRVELQKQKMEQALDRFNQRDKSLFARITDAMIKKDQARFNVFCNELTEIRKMTKQLLTAKISLQETHDSIQKQIDAETLGDGDLVVAAQLLTFSKTRLISTFPEAEREIGEIYDMLSGVIVNLITEHVDRKGSITEMYDRVELEAEQQMKEKLPSIPEMS